MPTSEARLGPTFELEAAELDRAAGLVAGVDEAGRGPWAGPVVAAAVILDPERIPDGIDDSKALAPEEREEVYERIVATAQFSVAIAPVARIDRVNILNATLWAMRRAVTALERRPRVVFVDGNQSPRLRCATRMVVGGDATCLSIAAASIVAKVTRDRLMVDLARELPGYGFERHKGYGTPEHQEALTRLGASAHHRRSFRPVQIALGLVTDAE
jgi:ribonuclease HII